MIKDPILNRSRQTFLSVKKCVMLCSCFGQLVVLHASFLGKSCETKTILPKMKVQMCPPIVTLLGRGQSVTVGKRHYKQTLL